MLDREIKIGSSPTVDVWGKIALGAVTMGLFYLIPNRWEGLPILPFEWAGITLVALTLNWRKALASLLLFQLSILLIAVYVQGYSIKALLSLPGMMMAEIAAVIVTARNSATGVRVDRIHAMADCGRLINPDLARQQIEGGIVFGLAQAFGSATDFESGLPTARRLRDIDLPKLADVPEITVELVRNDEAPGGVSELGVPAVAPAIANALFSAAGIRLRELPLLSKGL